MSDDPVSAEDVARSWERMTRLGNDCPGELFEAGFRLNLLASDDAEAAWNAIELIIDAMDRRKLIDEGDDDLRRLASNLGAGPLETLLAAHGVEMIARLEARATEDDRAAWILGCVWQGSMPDEIWDRVRKAAGGLSR